MKAYKLIERRENLARPIVYKIVPDKDNTDFNVFIVGGLGTSYEYDYFLTTEIKETKRGWTLTAWLLTVKPIKIFLPRENFEKVEL